MAQPPYNREAANWVWATPAQARQYKSRIGPNFDPEFNVEPFDTLTHGRGIRAKRDFALGDVICMYHGRFIREGEADASRRDADGYEVDVTPGWVMSIAPDEVAASGGPGAYANDAEPPLLSGFWRADKDPEYKARKNYDNNSRFQRRQFQTERFTWLNVLVLVATRAIPKGHEIFVSYGEKYWYSRMEEVSSIAMSESDAEARYVDSEQTGQSG